MSLDLCDCGQPVDTDADDSAYYLDDEPQAACRCLTCRKALELPGIDETV